MLHITNGDSAGSLIERSGVGGTVLPWRDVLHEGPVPAGLSPAELRPIRALFIAEDAGLSFAEVLRSFAERDRALETLSEHDEVVLWFEHDLYDQLQLIQVLDVLAQRAQPAGQLSLIQADTYLGTMTPEQLAALFPNRRPVAAEQLALAQAAWTAFRSPDPQAIVALLGRDTAALPYLADALRRHLQQFPAVNTGLSRSQRQGLEAIRDGAAALHQVYQASHHGREERIFLGDTTFAAHLALLSNSPFPLVLLEDGGVLRGPSAVEPQPGFWQQRLRLTERGLAVLDGHADWLALGGIRRWLGGVQLSGSSPWRWDDDRGVLVPGS
jgi:hypothetical protein